MKAKGHRVPIIGLYPKTENSVKLELLDDNDQTIKEMELKVQTDGLPEEMDDMVSVEKVPENLPMVLRLFPVRACIIRSLMM